MSGEPTIPGHTAGQASHPDSSDLTLEQLGRRRQIYLMRQVAEMALSAYQLRAHRLTLAAHGWNTIFRVDTESEHRYALRIHRAGTPTTETVNSELMWLAALRRDTTLEVPNPVTTSEGALFTTASAPGAPRPFICVLFRWLQGRLVEWGLTPRHLALVGEFMAQLQNHAQQWKRPPGFTRGRVDWPLESGRWARDPLAPEIVASIYDLVASALSKDYAAITTSVLERVRAAEQVLGNGPDAFGLMHADLHFRNLLFGRGVVRALDFDDCGYGYHLFDHAVMLSELLDRENYPALRAGLLAGYRQMRPLPEEHEALIDTFIALRRVQDALWLLHRLTETNVSSDWANRVRASLDHLARFLAAGGQFLESSPL